MFGQRSGLSQNKKKKTVRGKLSIDTTCAVQNQVFPYESRIPQLKFVSFDESQARTQAVEKGPLEGKTPVYPGAEKDVSNGLLGHNPSVRSQRGDVMVATPAVAYAQAAGGLSTKRAKKLKPLKIASRDQNYSGDGCENDLGTPRIVITPAREDFNAMQTLQVKGCRPASSVYSRYTNCVSTSTAPPVPPLPFMGTGSAGLKSRFSAVTATTTFEDVSPLETHEKIYPVQTPGLPTPRRSKGWWNILSPFSAKSTIQTFFRSPPPLTERTPVLRDAAAMGEADSLGVERGSDDLSEKSRHSVPGLGTAEPMNAKIPQRSVTAPAALHGDVKAFDVYHIASTGLAAAYFDVARRFPSLYVGSEDRDGISPGWSPSQSVLGSPRVLDVSARDTRDSIRLMAGSEGPAEHAEKQREAPKGSATPSATNAPGGTIFATPSSEELQTPPQPRPMTARGMTQVTETSIMSPLSATPTVQQAHLGMPIGPASSFGEQREIAVSRAPTPTALDVGATSTRHESFVPSRSPPYPTNVSRMRATHVRQDSYGLGITDPKNELYPPPVYVEERPRLVTDRYGQLTIRSPASEGPTIPWHRRFFWAIAFAAAVILLVFIVLLVIFIPQKHNDMAVEASWLNLTGLPAIPIGISTIIQPQMKDSRDTCVTGSMWSCAAPSEAGTGDLPNFRLEVRSRNMTISKLSKRSSWKDYIYSALPAPPSEADQLYLGRTTDNVSAPYNGERSPFVISLLDAVALPTASSIQKRSSNFSYPYPTSSSDHDNNSDQTKVDNSAATNIPKPNVQTNGKPDDPVLYPYVTAQPLRLYNRGQDTEHYGFYTYFDRSFYINSSDASTSPLPWNTTSNDNNNNITSNVPLTSASAVCTFSQTRLHIQIWTRRGLVGNHNTALSTPSAPSPSSPSQTATTTSTANTLSHPGSFPYPVTITVDRHGGLAAKKKGVYCYGIDAETRRVDGSVKGWVREDRGVGGELFDGAQVPGEVQREDGRRKRGADDESKQRERGGRGKGIDGGSGGCFCQWGT